MDMTWHDINSLWSLEVTINMNMIMLDNRLYCVHELHNRFITNDYMEGCFKVVFKHFAARTTENYNKI
jgi:hypothetical protein